MIRIVLADDHRIFREGLKLLLVNTAEFVLVGEAANGEEALRLITELRPDVAVLDLSMPGMHGIEVVKRVLDAELATRCILLTMNDEIARVRRTLQAGVCSYILKESAYDQLVAAIVAVNDGQLFIGSFEVPAR